LLFLAVADPNAARALLKQGLVALQQGNLPEAQKDLEQASQLDRKNPYTWSSLAEVYLRLKQPDKALDAAKAAEADGAGNPVITHALAMFYANAGDLYTAAGDAKRALPLFQTGWEHARSDPQIAFDYAEALLKAQQFSEAANVAETVLKANPHNAQLTLTLGVARYGQRRFEEAITLFLQTIAIDPTIEQPYEFLGRVLDQAGPHLPEILKHDEAWAAENPQNAKAQMLLAKTLLVSDPKSKRAEELLRRSIALDANDWESHYELGVLLASEASYREAAVELVHATELNEKQPMPHYHLARVYDRLGEPDKAKAEREIHKRLTAPSGQ
jgi:tetratricopeptide (TPR) repeat protein